MSAAHEPATILSLLGLRDRQADAVALRERHTAVTAGAGSGKTRALVGRYLALLEDGEPLRALVAITFTEKAAREMRSRIRGFITQWMASKSLSAERITFWRDAYAQLDNARIGTIHALCAAVLRAHPAEAGLDPAFEVLDENDSAAMRARAVESALARTANDADSAALFTLLHEAGLRTLLGLLLSRPDAWPPNADPAAHWQAARAAAVGDAITAFAAADAVRNALSTLAELHDARQLASVAGDKLAPQIESLRALWAQIGQARAAADWATALPLLFEWRRSALSGRAGKAGAAKEAVKALREAYDDMLAPWLGGQNANDDPPDWTLDMQALAALPLVQRALAAARAEYARLKAERRALDFDDLEAGTDALLARSAPVRERWRGELRAVLVDEFQDTNERQRRIIYALCGLDSALPDDARAGARLFIVGDAKQSIYRFRGADVTVFRAVQADLRRRGGALLDFDLTYRAHAPLVGQFNVLLEPILGSAADPERPYAVPYAALRAHRAAPDAVTHEPFVELCLGSGDDADNARQAAAMHLAERLKALRRDGVEWGRMALLFRASTNFPLYEDAFETAGIPYVTVAGKGFYDRPEVRDLLNLLAAVTNPADDLALAGALRSPAFGLSDAALYQLRRADGALEPRSLWSALQGDMAWLGAEAAAARRARAVIEDISSRAGRISVAAVLKTLLDESGYRAALRRLAARRPDLQRIAERALRNVDKLLADAHASGLVSAAEFVEYAASMRDLAAREGEAPVEAGQSVQLMTVHKAKGLEFDVVVIADAAHGSHGGARFLLDPTLGPLFPIAAGDSRSVLDRLAGIRDGDQADAEERRLLYVAATRARERLIVSGHVKPKSDGLPQLNGWLKWIGERAGLDNVPLPPAGEKPQAIELPGLACTVCNAAPVPAAPPDTARAPAPAIDAPAADLLAPVYNAAAERADDAPRPTRVWRVVPTAARPRGPAWVTGTLVHEALRRWRFPGESGFEELLRPHALSTGLIDAGEMRATLADARRLLARFHADPLFTRLDRAERLHEVPYELPEPDGGTLSGVIDLLYRDAPGAWQILDFKTDEIRTEAQLTERADYHGRQVRAYQTAVRQLLGVAARAQICFLDMRGELRVIDAA